MATRSETVKSLRSSFSAVDNQQIRGTLAGHLRTNNGSYPQHATKQRRPYLIDFHIVSCCGVLLEIAFTALLIRWSRVRVTHDPPDHNTAKKPVAASSASTGFCLARTPGTALELRHEISAEELALEHAKAL